MLRLHLETFAREMVFESALRATPWGSDQKVLGLCLYVNRANHNSLNDYYQRYNTGMMDIFAKGSGKIINKESIHPLSNVERFLTMYMADKGNN